MGKKKIKGKKASPQRRAQRKRQPKPLSYGQHLGSVIGRALGGATEQLFRHVTGMGAYKINQNSLLPGNDPPKFEGSEATRVRHREYLGDISGSTGFLNQSYSLNPGISSTFPWLANIASGYEEYQFLGLIFEFKSTSAVALNSTNTALGTVIMATEYNATKPAFTSKIQMENYEYASSAAPSMDQMHPVECDPKLTPFPKLFVRGAGATVGDLKTYDLGTFQLAVVGMQAAAVIGELWVTYDVALYKPMMNVSGGSLTFYAPDHYRSTTGITNTSWLGSTGTMLMNGIGGTVLNSGSGKYLFSADTDIGDVYRVTLIIYGSSSAWVNPSFTLSSGLSQVSSPVTGSGQWLYNATSQSLVGQYIVQMNASHYAGNTEFIAFTSGTGTVPTSPTDLELFVDYLGNGFV